MALVTKRIYRIVDDLANLNPAQIGIDATADADLGYKMWGGKDELGTVTKWLSKGYPGSLSTLTLTGGTTTGDLGLLKHDVSGGISGGQLTVSQFNNYISDGGIVWTRDAVNGRVSPITGTDKVQAGDGSAATPGLTFDNNPTSGLYLGNILGANAGVGVAHGGVEMAGFGVISGTSTMVCAPELAFKMLHQWDTASGVNTMSIENNATQTGIESHLTISCTAVNALNDITIDSQELIFNAYNNMDFTADLGTITIQAQGTTLGGVVIESDWFEFQNYTAYSPIPVWNSNAQWAAYEATFGTEYPILQAMVDLSGGAVSHNSLSGLQGGDATGGGERYHLTADEYSDLRDNLPVVGGRVFYSASGGELSAHQYLTWDYTAMELSVYHTAGVYFTKIKHDGTYGRIITNSSPVAIGNENTDHSLNAAGDLITRKLEVNNNLYIDLAAIMNDGTRLYMGSAAHRSILVLSTDQTNDSFLWTVNSAKSISIIDETYLSSDFGLALQSNPSLFVFSSANPAVDNTQYGRLTHDQTDFLIGSGTNTLKLLDSSFYFNSTYDYFKITNNVNQTNWHDSNAAAIHLTGTATQGQVIFSDKDLIAGSYASGSINSTFQAETSGANTYIATTNLLATKNSATTGGATVNVIASVGGGEAGSDSEVNIISRSQGVTDGNHEINIFSEIQSVNYGLTIDGNAITYSNIATINHSTGVAIDFNSADLREIDAITFKKKSASFATGTLTVNATTGTFQEVDFNANITTFTIGAPTGNDCTRITLWLKNTDASAHTIGGISGYNLISPLTNGYSVAAGATVHITMVFRDATWGWDIALSEYS